MLKTTVVPLITNRTSTILFCALLAACGGGGGDSTAAGSGTGSGMTPTSDSSTPSGSGSTPSPVISNPPLPSTSGDAFGSGSTTIGIVGEQTYTAAGSGGVSFQVSGVTSGETAQWSLNPGDPGSLDKTSGNAVTYTPPPADSIDADTTVSITVTAGQATATARLLVLAAAPLAQVPPTSPAPSTFAVVSQSERATAGGAPVTLTASKPPSSGTVSWSLEPGSPGTLDRNSGDSVQYLPPAAGTNTNGVNVTINASLGNETRKTTIVLEGAQGLSLLAGNDGGAGNRDGAGTAARFYNPSDTTIDAQGTVYITDTWNRTIRKFTSDGIVTTLAGSPYDPFSGSVDGAGTSARFSDPQGIAVDGAGNIYVADAKAIRKISPAGIVTTLAGKADAAGNVDGTGDQARFRSPYRIAVDAAGNLFVTDVDAIRRITPSGTVTTVARTDRRLIPALQMLNTVRGIAVDRSGNLYVVDAFDQNSARDISYASSSIRKIAPNGVVTTLAGVDGTVPRTEGAIGSRDGSGTDARFNSPDGITIDADGNLFVSDMGNRTIRKVTPAGDVTTVAGSPGLSGSADGNGAAARFLAPMGITSGPDGNIYLADSFSNTIRQVAANGDVITVAGKPASYGYRDGNSTSALFWNPAGIAGDGLGNMFIADRNNHSIRRVSAAGEVTTIAGMAGQPGAVNGTGADARFLSPSDVAVDSTGNLYVADTGNSLIRKITPTGAVTTVLTQYRATAIAVDADGNVYAGDFSSPIVRKITPSGAVTELSLLIPSETYVPIGDIVADADGNLFATTFSGIRKVTRAGAVSLVGPQAPPSASPIIAPLPSITMDEEGNLYTNLPDGTLRKTTQTGQTTEVFDLEPLGFVKGFAGERKYFEMVAPKTIAITIPNGIYLLRLP